MAYEQLDPKDPDSLNDHYKFDLSNYLQTGELVNSIISITSSDAGLTVASSSITDSGTSITVWLSGGTLGVWANVTARFDTTSSPARTDERTFQIKIGDL